MAARISRVVGTCYLTMALLDTTLVAADNAYTNHSNPDLSPTEIASGAALAGGKQLGLYLLTPICLFAKKSTEELKEYCPHISRQA